MNDEKEKTKQEINSQIIYEAWESNLILHLTLVDNSFRNGTVVELFSDFFKFNDKKNGIEPIFFLELRSIKPYLEKEKEDGRN